MAEVAFCVDADTVTRSSLPDEYATEEVGTALSYTRRKTDYELSLALDLRDRLPQVRRVLDAGLIDPPKAALLCSQTRHLDAGTAHRVVDRILPAAPDLTTGQLRARLQRCSLEADPDTARDRMEYSLQQRRVVAEPNPEGTAALIISECLPQDIYTARDHINLLARRLKTKDEARSIDQLRADVAIGLLTGQIGGESAKGGSINLQVDLTTLAELDSKPGELGGYGPIVAEIARKVADEQRNGEWSATITDPETGEPRHVVSVRRRPTARQLRKIRGLHPTCTFKGCRMPAVDCDIDHIVEYARGGETLVRNQVPLCRRHHLARHRGGWKHCKIGRTEVAWVSPLGRRYRTGRPP